MVMGPVLLESRPHSPGEGSPLLPSSPFPFCTVLHCPVVCIGGGMVMGPVLLELGLTLQVRASRFPLSPLPYCTALHCIALYIIVLYSTVELC